MQEICNKVTLKIPPYLKRIATLLKKYKCQKTSVSCVQWQYSWKMSSS